MGGAPSLLPISIYVILMAEGNTGMCVPNSCLEISYSTSHFSQLFGFCLSLIYYTEVRMPFQHSSFGGTFTVKIKNSLSYS